ncbi:MAG: hypothetical protein ABJI96_08915 [Paracoccaceae bacterium]
MRGAFVSIDGSGRLRIERGYVRSEDEPVEEADDVGDVAPEDATVHDAEDTVALATEDEEEDDGLKLLSDRLVMELTAHRKLALRNALAQDLQGRFPRGPARHDPTALLPLACKNTLILT